MNIISVKVGDIRTNCYIITKDNYCLIIDPGSDDIHDIAEIKSNINRYELLAVLYTHNHYDHIKGGYYFPQVTHFMHEKDIATLDETNKRTQAHYGFPIIPPKSVKPLQTTMTIGPFHFDVIHTPGHTQGSVCFYFSKEQILFSGDTLFAQTYGRTDLPFGDETTMKQSLRELHKLPLETKVYPGHGKTTSIEAEKAILNA